MNIDQLDVNEKWKRKFEIFEKAGANKGYSNINYNGIEPKQRNLIMFNSLAFIFSPFYYFVKKMPEKALVLLGIGFLMVIILELFRFFTALTLPNIVYAIPLSALCGIFANYDFYRKKVHCEKMWKKFSVFSSLWAAILFCVIAFTITISALYLLETSQSTKNITVISHTDLDDKALEQLMADPEINKFIFEDNQK